MTQVTMHVKKGVFRIAAHGLFWFPSTRGTKECEFDLGDSTAGCDKPSRIVGERLKVASANGKTRCGLSESMARIVAKVLHDIRPTAAVTPPGAAAAEPKIIDPSFAEVIITGVDVKPRKDRKERAGEGVMIVQQRQGRTGLLAV